MPRFSGVSMTETVWWIFLNPNPATQALWLFSRPCLLLTSVTFISFGFAMFLSLCLLFYAPSTLELLDP